MGRTLKSIEKETQKIWPISYFVGGLSWDTTDAGLQKAFALYGEITEAKVITDRDTGRSRGFEFVTFVRDEDAKNAMSKMNDASLDGRGIIVNEAKEKRGREGSRGGRNRY